MAEEPREPEIHPSAKIHKSAVIHPSTKIAEGVRIGPRVKIDTGATIGADTRIDEAAEIGRNIDISNGNVRIGHHARIGDDTRIESQPRTTRTRAGEYALVKLKTQENTKAAGLKPKLLDMNGRCCIHLHPPPIGRIKPIGQMDTAPTLQGAIAESATAINPRCDTATRRHGDTATR